MSGSQPSESPDDGSASDSDKSSNHASDLDLSSDTDVEDLPVDVLRIKWAKARGVAERYKRKYQEERTECVKWKERAVVAEAAVKRFRGAAQQSRREEKQWEIGPVLYDDIQRYLNLRLTKSQYKFPHVIRTTARMHKQWVVAARYLFSIKFIAEVPSTGDRATIADLRGPQGADESPEPVKLELAVVTNTGRVLAPDDFNSPEEGYIFDSEQVPDGNTVMATRLSRR